MGPILTTKLHIPTAHPNRIKRPHLIQKLDADLWLIEGGSFLRRLTLIAAPAGYGKTTLLYEWVTHLNIPAAWISFDETDNDLGSFLHYLIAALQTIHTHLGDAHLSLLQSPQTQVTGEAAAHIMVALVNELTQVTQPFFLVFDDYHTVESQEIHLVVKLLLDRLPETLSLVIATRADPPLPLSRLRARRQMLEVRANDLRFSEYEAGSFLRQGMQLDIEDAEISTLTEGTEGWAAGLQMAAISLQGRGNRAEFIHHFSGRERFVIDYLFEEVLSRQPEDIQAFLIQTSILERMSGPLCEAVLGNQFAGSASLPTSSGFPQQSSQKILEYLDRANLFIVPLDDQREWFRYHHLFTDLLRHQLRRSWPAERIAGLYERTSAWFERQGLIDEAMHYAAYSGNQQQLAKLVVLSGNTLAQTGQVAQRARLIHLLSPETLRSNPGLCIECAWTEMFARPSPDLRQAEVYLHMAKQGCTEDPASVDGSGYPVAYRVAHTRAILSRFKGDAPETVIEFTQKALDLLPQDDFTYRCSLLQNLGMAYVAIGNLEAAWKNLEQCWQEAQVSGVAYVATAAAYMMSRCLQTQGRLDAMDRLLKTTLADLRRTEMSSGRTIPALGILHVAYAWLLFEPGNGDAARIAAVEQEVRQGLERCALTAEHYVLAKGYALQARLLAAQSDFPGAYHRLEEMAARWLEAAGFSAAARIRLMLSQNGHDVDVERFAAQLPSALDEQVYPVSITPQVWHWEEQMGLARLWIARKRRSPDTDLSPVLHSLNRLIQICAPAGWQMQCIELYLLKALALDANHETRTAIEALSQALRAAEACGFYRLLLEEGEPLACLLDRSAGSLPEIPILRRLMADLRRKEQPVQPIQPVHLPAQEQHTFRPVDLLTERELEVLRLLAAGLSNKEIAQKLVLTVGTVKTHTSNIYRKLDVLGRTRALAKARELNLL